MTLYRLRTVVLDCSGKTAVVLATCDLTASTIEQAKAEAERHSCHPKQLPAPHGLEIIDGQCVVLARRTYEGQTWRSSGTE
jgi:hypothetical protein